MLTIERIFAAPDLSGASLRSPQISPDGRYVAYLRGGDQNKDRLDLWAYDIAAKKHTLLVEAARLVPQERALSAEEEARRERQRTSSLSGIVEYQFSPDSHSLLVPLGGDLYVYNLRAKPAEAVRQITQTDSFETDARFSPKGRYVSFVRDQNLIVYDLTTGQERAITRDGGGLVSFGVAEFIAQEEMGRTTGYWWSPDEKRIAFTRVDESPVAEVERFEIYADSVKVVKQRYPAAGAKNAVVQLFVADLSKPDAAPVEMDLGENTDVYLPRVNWFPNSQSLAVQRQSRDQKTLTLAALGCHQRPLDGAAHRKERYVGRSQRRAHDARALVAAHLGLASLGSHASLSLSAMTASSSASSRRATGMWSPKASAPFAASTRTRAACTSWRTRRRRSSGISIRCR